MPALNGGVFKRILCVYVYEFAIFRQTQYSSALV